MCQQCSNLQCPQAATIRNVAEVSYAVAAEHKVSEAFRVEKPELREQVAVELHAAQFRHVPKHVRWELCEAVVG